MQTGPHFPWVWMLESDSWARVSPEMAVLGIAELWREDLTMGRWMVDAEGVAVVIAEEVGCCAIGCAAVRSDRLLTVQRAEVRKCMLD